MQEFFKEKKGVSKVKTAKLLLTLTFGSRSPIVLSAHENIILVFFVSYLFLNSAT